MQDAFGTSTTVTVASCSINAQSVTLKLGTISTTVNKVVLTVGNFINPASTCDVSYVLTQLLDITGTTMVQYLTSTISGFTGGTMTTAALTSSS